MAVKTAPNSPGLIEEIEVEQETLTIDKMIEILQRLKEKDPKKGTSLVSASLEGWSAPISSLRLMDDGYLILG